MKTVKEVSDLTGVSVRTLHHYDAIGLLKPSRITDAGYRLYDAAALRRLHAILLFRELQFPLREIRSILDVPGFDPRDALEQQLHLLTLQREHLDRLISHAREIQRTGVIPMNFSAFDTTKMNEYAREAKERWGSTDAYREYEEKRKGRMEKDFSGLAAEMMKIFARFGALRSGNPGSEAAQDLVAELQGFITEHYYTCTREILPGLAAMYTDDPRFMENIDAAGGEGTAKFAREAIEVYCGSK